jgi:hypothetical protein
MVVRGGLTSASADRAITWRHPGPLRREAPQCPRAVSCMHSSMASPLYTVTRPMRLLLGKRRCS